MDQTKKYEQATFGGGCFWCLEAVYKRLRGVVDVFPGYCGGITNNPTYHEVKTGTTGHAEVVQVTFDPSEIPFRQLLEVFFSIHDPTTLNRQGADVGTQYRSVVFYHNPKQKEQVEEIITYMQQHDFFDKSIVTEVAMLTKFYIAEDYHHDYFEKNPDQGYCQMVVAPKVNKFKKTFQTLLKDSGLK